MSFVLVEYWSQVGAEHVDHVFNVFKGIVSVYLLQTDIP